MPIPTAAPPVNGRLLIGGQWAEAASGKTFETVNPATGEVLARVAEGDQEDVNRAVAAAKAARKPPNACPVVNVLNKNSPAASN